MDDVLAFVVGKVAADGPLSGVRRVGGWLRPLQTGFVRNYAAVTFAGVVGLLVWFVSRGVG